MPAHQQPCQEEAAQHCVVGVQLTHVTTCNHDAVSLGENVIIVVEALLVLDLCNDLNVATTWAKHVTDGVCKDGTAVSYGMD